MPTTFLNFKNWLKWAVSLALLAAPTLSQSCIWYDLDEGRVWIFAPNLVNIPSLLPFTYTYERYYAPYDYPEQEPAHYRQNVREWQAAAGAQAKEVDVYAVLYTITPQDYFSGKGLKTNSFIVQLAKPENRELKQYLDFAKRCEALMNDQDRAWSQNPVQGFAELTTEGEALLAAAQSPFVQLRAAYQVMKLHQYQEQYDRGLAVYKQYIEPHKGSTWITGSALYHYALMQSDPVEKNYWYARAFDAFEGNRFVIQLSYNKKLREATLRRAQNNREKAAIELISQLNNKGRALPELERVYQLAPDYDDLRMLMSREVNKLEDWIFSPRLLRYAGYDYTHGTGEFSEEEGAAARNAEKDALLADLQYLRKVRAFVEKVVKDARQPDQAFWQLTGAYLAFIDGDYEKANALLAAIKNRDKLPINVQLQLGVTEAMVAIMQADAVTPDTDAGLLKLYELIQKNDKAFPEMERFRSEVSLLLSDWLIRKGAKAKGALLLSQCTRSWGEFIGVGRKSMYHKLLDIAGPADYTEALRILSEPATPFEKWLTQNPNHIGKSSDGWGGVYVNGEWLYPGDEKIPAHYYKWNLDRIRDFQSMYYIRRNQLDSALWALNDIAPAYWKDHPYHEYLKTNPFSAGIQIASLKLTNPQAKAPTDKAAFLRKLIELQAEAERDPKKRSENYLLIANAYYQMSYHGRWWLTVMPAKSMTETYQAAAELLPDNATGEAAPRLPGSLWTFTLLGLSLALGITIRGKNPRRLLWLLPLGLLAFVPLNSCKKEAGVTLGFNAEEEVFLQDYYLARRAAGWYEKCIEAEPQGPVAALAAYMLDRIAHDNDVLYTERDWSAELPPFKANRLPKIAPGNIALNPSCAGFVEELKKSGWKVESRR